MSRTNRIELRGQSPRIATALPNFRLVGHGRTDVGLRREVNEDSYLILPKNSIWIVADGMGGHAGGQVASRLTVEKTGSTLLKLLGRAEDALRKGHETIDLGAIMTEAIQETCHAVFDEALDRPALAGMGSTVTAAMVYGSDAWIGHVGDSRAYLIRNGTIVQKTKDHSLVQEQVDAGLINAEQAKHSMIRNIITRSIGFERDVQVDAFSFPIQRGDHILLCTDGLTGHVEDDEILEIVLNNPRRIVPAKLIELANSRGGEDNSTVTLTTVVSRRGRQRDKRRRSGTETRKST